MAVRSISIRYCSVTSATTRRVLVAALLSLACMFSTLPASANHLGYRYVTVNGERLNYQQMLEADRAVGFRLPNGHYWWDQRSGYWGVVGRPPSGRVAPVRPQASRGGGRANGRITNTLIDPSGGCEGGSCVNILD